MKKDLVNFLLSDFRDRPGMYLGDYSLSKLSVLVTGFMIACNIYNKNGIDRFSEFHDWFEKRHSLERCSSWTWPFLEMVNHDEKAALDLFFSELEIFATENSL